MKIMMEGQKPLAVKCEAFSTIIKESGEVKVATGAEKLMMAGMMLMNQSEAFSSTLSSKPNGVVKVWLGF